MTEKDLKYSFHQFKKPPSTIKFRPHSSSPRIGTYDEHKKRLERYCKSQATIYENQNPTHTTVHLKPNHCHSWDCECCRIKNAKRLTRRIKEGITAESWRLLTLTVDPNHVGISAAPEIITQMWDVFLKRVKRRYGNFKFIRVLEFQANGYPHLHVIMNLFLPHAYVKRVWTNLGGGKIVDIRAIKNQNIARYVGRYLSREKEKHAEHDHKFWDYSLRRYAFSRNFPLAPWEDRTTIFFSSMCWDCAPDFFNYVCDWLVNERVFVAVRGKTFMKYINLPLNSSKKTMC